MISADERTLGIVTLEDVLESLLGDYGKRNHRQSDRSKGPLDGSDRLPNSAIFPPLRVGL